MAKPIVTAATITKRSGDDAQPYVGNHFSIQKPRCDVQVARFRFSPYYISGLWATYRFL
jgi:hypothetical protein